MSSSGALTGIFRPCLLQDDLRPARLTVHFPVLRNKNLVAAKGTHLIAIRSRVPHALDLESVGAHPRKEGVKLAPAGGHNAQALDDHFKDGDLAHSIGRVSGVLFEVGELGDRDDHHSKESATDG